MQFHSEEEKTLIESFRQNGGTRTFFFRHGEPRIAKPVAKALSHLLRSGHIERHSSGDIGWVCYRLKEEHTAPAEMPDMIQESSDGKTEQMKTCLDRELTGPTKRCIG